MRTLQQIVDSLPEGMESHIDDVIAAAEAELSNALVKPDPVTGLSFQVVALGNTVMWLLNQLGQELAQEGQKIMRLHYLEQMLELQQAALNKKIVVPK